MVDCEVFDYITPIRSDSIRAASHFENNYFDFIFIDGNHEYEIVRKDIETWFLKLKTDGIIAGDDYDPCHGGVIKAVDEIFGELAKKSWPVWYVKK
jgi:predicted O-methyltransferase YrrM